MCRVVDLQQAVLAKNDACAHTLREDLAARGTAVVNLLSSPGSGKTALLEGELALARGRGVPVAALTADLATENDAVRLARSGVPVKQILTDGLCHLEAEMLGGHLHGWLPADTRLLFIENVGNLVCPASYDLGETLRVVLASVTEGEDKPLKYPTAFGLAHLVVVTKTDIADAVSFDEAEFRANVQRVNPGVEVVLTSVRAEEGTGVLLDRALAARDGAPVHIPVMTRKSHHVHDTEDPRRHDESHSHGHGPGHAHEHGPAHRHDHPHDHSHGHEHGHDHAHAPHGAGDHSHRAGPGSVAPSRS
ncbi:hydrogenase nickel incorporation protein HypB [Streptomyces sp. NPDC056411]|uniref:hydrogenase nickel incorporation protein HypB n=1 Tax=Streptomyces sp. NPDC056411 TaxID=3345813 RepID=UPI0035D7836E